MKIVFEAFQGKLKSNPIDVPEDTSDVFDMVLDTGVFEKVGYAGDKLSERPSLPKKCRFQWTGKYYAYSDCSARIYQLTDVD